MAYILESCGIRLESLKGGEKINKKELLKWYNSLGPCSHIQECVKMDDANYKQVLMDGEWQTYPYAWSVFQVGNVWKYVETDDERGYVFDYKEFQGEGEACAYAFESLLLQYRAKIAARIRKEYKEKMQEI